MRRRRTAAALLAVTVALLAGCTSGGPTLGGSAEHDAIFSREQTPEDRLPDDIMPLWDASTSRYVGEDSGGDHYWAAHDGARHVCIVVRAADSATSYTSSCGGGSMSLTIGAVKVEFASAPQDLTEENAELIGGTLLVRRP